MATPTMHTQCPVTFASLLREMADLDALTRFPDPPFRMVQFSSYDRCSKQPYESGWFANSDGFGGEPTPNFQATTNPPGDDGVGEYLLCDVTGPGAIVRTWTARITGELTVRLDDQPQPLYRGDAATFLRDPYLHFGGDAAQQHVFTQRDASYLPIPFAERCRIEWRGNTKEAHFYAVQVRQYEPGTRVTTFAPDDLSRHVDAITSIGEQFRAAAIAPMLQDTPHTVAPGERVTVFSHNSHSGAIRQFSIRVHDDQPDAALRRTVLRMYFDDAPTPQVESPLGDFFGVGPGVHPYESLPMSVAADGAMTCRFTMPFARTARVELENWCEHDVAIYCDVRVGDYRWVDGRSMHFFAKWRADHGLLATHGGVGCDIPYLCARGKGMLVGVAAILMNPTPIPTRWGGWWGEGDEKIWIDDDDFPSIFGTGSEDYFNYAWSSAQLFHHPYFAQPLASGPGNRGYVANCRWHILDPLPFHRSIAFFMELLTHRETPGFSYARIVYYYAMTNTRDDHLPLRPDVAIIPELPAWTPVASPNSGTEGAEFFEAEALMPQPSSGQVTVVDHPWASGGKMLRWTDAPAGATLTLSISAGAFATEGPRLRLGVVMLKSPQCAAVRATFDGKPLEGMGDRLDLTSPLAERFGEYEGEVDTDPGCTMHTLQLTRLDDQPLVAIDFIWIRPSYRLLKNDAE